MKVWLVSVESTDLGYMLVLGRCFCIMYFLRYCTMSFELLFILHIPVNQLALWKETWNIDVSRVVRASFLVHQVPLQSCGIAECLCSFLSALECLIIHVVQWLLTYSITEDSDSEPTEQYNWSICVTLSHTSFGTGIMGLLCISLIIWLIFLLTVWLTDQLTDKLTDTCNW